MAIGSMLRLLLLVATLLQISGSEGEIPSGQTGEPTVSPPSITSSTIVQYNSSTNTETSILQQSTEAEILYSTYSAEKTTQVSPLPSENSQPGVITTSTTSTSSNVETSTAESSYSTAETTTEEAIHFIDILGDDQTTVASETNTGQTTTESGMIETTTIDIKIRRERLSDQIRSVIKHYKEFGTVTVPDASVPDPMPIPTTKKTFSGNDMTFTNTKVYGLSNFTIEHVNTDLDKMQVYVAIYMKRLVILGNYTAKVFFRKVAGPYNVTLLYVEASGAAALVKDKEGNLQASDSEMDMTFMDSKVNFGNMGIMGTLLQGMAASAGPVLFDAIKPIVLTEINQKVREDINKKIKKIGTKFAETGTKPPLDIALEEGRNYVRENGYDPYVIDNYVLKYMPTNNSLFKVNISNLTLTGLSNFRRVGEVSLSMDSGTVQMGIHLATSKLRGKCTWSLVIGQFQRNGQTNFTVDYVQGRGFVNQSLDVTKHPVLEDLDVNVGKVRLKMRGSGPFDIVVEALVNTLPDLIRHVIVDAIEAPMKFGIQQILNEVNVEEVLERQLPELDKMGL